MFDDLIKKKRKGIPVKATKRKLRARWTVELENDLKTIYSIKKGKGRLKKVFKDIIEEKKVVGLKPLEWHVPLKEMVKMHRNVIDNQHTALIKANDEIKVLNKYIDYAMVLLQEASDEIVRLREKEKILSVNEWMESPIVRDINGVEILPGDSVLILQDEGIRKGVVMETFSNRPTEDKSGYWVDIDCGEGLEVMMSYVLEVVKVVLNIEQII